MDLEPNPDGKENGDDFDKVFNPDDCPTIDGVKFCFKVPEAELPMIDEGSLKRLED